MDFPENFATMVKNQKLLVLDFKVEVGNGRYAAGILLKNVLQRKTCHNEITSYIFRLFFVVARLFNSNIITEKGRFEKSSFSQKIFLIFVKLAQNGVIFL